MTTRQLHLHIFTSVCRTFLGAMIKIKSVLFEKKPLSGIKQLQRKSTTEVRIKVRSESRRPKVFQKAFCQSFFFERFSQTLVDNFGRSQGDRLMVERGSSETVPR